MDRETLSLLGFPKVLDMVERLAQSPLGQSRISRLKPMKDGRQVEAKLALVEECVGYRQEQGRIDCHDLEDLQVILEGLRVAGTVLEPNDFLLLLKILLMSHLTQLKLWCIMIS